MSVETELDLSAVPLFPLPGVVLFPRAVLPLHIFEDRYRAMTADALSGDKTIAMALLRAGWEKSYYGRPAIESVVCVGRILSSEMLEDGKYNFLLQGQLRARIVREIDGDRQYRRAELQRLEQVPAMEIDLSAERDRLSAIFTETALGRIGAGRQFREIIRGDLPTAAIADLAAFTFLDDVPLKQALLEEIDVRQRVARTVSALSAVASAKPQAAFSFSGKPSLN